jgi:hypothetical protein
MSRRYIIAMMVLVHNIAWTINTGLYFPISVGTGAYGQKEVICLSDTETDSSWDTIKRYPGQIGFNSDLRKEFTDSFQSLEKFLKTPKLGQLGLGYQFSSNFSVEFKFTAVQSASHMLSTFTAVTEKVKQKLWGDEWRYGFSLSSQYNFPLTSSMRFYGKLGKNIYCYSSAPKEFKFNEFKNSVVKTFNKSENSLIKLFDKANWFGGAGLYYQWSSNKIIDFGWECYPSSFNKSDYLHFIKLGLNLYL